MILTGEGKEHADNLPDASYYTNKRSDISKYLFTETCFGVRFTPVILETIKKSHKTLPYILRNQYSNADEIYQCLINIPKEVTIEGGESAYCFHLYSRLKNCPSNSLQKYFEDVCESLIFPVFKRFGYYSPTMTVILFVGLLCHVGEHYNNQLYGLVWKHFVRNSYPAADITKCVMQLSQLDKDMVRDELEAWERYTHATRAVRPKTQHRILTDH